MWLSQAHPGMSISGESNGNSLATSVPCPTWTAGAALVKKSLGGRDLQVHDQVNFYFMLLASKMNIKFLLSNFCFLASPCFHLS